MTSVTNLQIQIEFLRWDVDCAISPADKAAKGQQLREARLLLADLMTGSDGECDD